MGSSSGVDPATYDVSLAKRQNEINQWEAGNKLDTLFVYQQMLIILSAIIVMTYLFKNKILGTTVFWSLTAILVCILIFTAVNRIQYTSQLRSKQYWSEREFPVDTVPIPYINICN